MKQIKKLYEIILSGIKGLDQSQRKRLISTIVAVAVVFGLAALPGLAADNAQEEGPHSVILSGEVTVGSITTQLHGGGTLSGAGPVSVRLPDGVKITEFLVDNYDTVKKGTPLAAVDKVSTLTVISAVQEKLDELEEKMNNADDGTGNATVEAQSKGVVKAVYAVKGDDVRTVMAEHGALAVISIDGLMAVEVETERKFSAGDKVWVAIGDTEVAGTVESALDGTLVVTVDDEGYTIGEEATVTDEEDITLGSGTLYVHQPWDAVAYSGTVSGVSVKENSSVSAGKTLFSLKNVDKSGTFEALIQEHQTYEELHQELFTMYQSGALLAPCDGMVSGVDKNSVHLLSADVEHEISLMANAPGTDPDIACTNYVGYISGIWANQWQVYMNTTPIQIADYKTELDVVSTDITSMNIESNISSAIQVYALDGEGNWVPVAAAEGDILLFADYGGTCVWAIRIGSNPVTPTPTPTPTPGGEGNTTGGRPSGGSGMPSGGGMSMGGLSGFSGMGAPAEDEDDADIGSTNIMAVIPQTEMTLSVLVDEQDISNVHLGQTADIQVDVLHGQMFTAVVTEIGTTGTSDGGNAKYTVELTMNWSEGILPGMSATATFTLNTTENILTIPVAALVDIGTETVVYTKKSGDELKKPVAVTTGKSDGETVEITSGLTEGKKFYYSYIEENAEV